MELTPDQIANATFRLVRKGFDPDEVQAFQVEAARALDQAQQYGALMEQRARAAVARAAQASQADQAGTGNTVTHGVDHTPSHPALTSSTVTVRADDAETIGRTLVLAQRAADQAIAEANEHAATIRAAAEADALRVRSDVELESARLLADARAEARRAGEAEREKVMGEVNALLARLEFLRDDVRAMESYAIAQRDRLTVAAEAMRALAETEVGHAASHHLPALSPVADQFRAEGVAVLSPVSSAAPVVAQEPVKVASAAVSAPSAGSTAPAPFTVSYSEDQTGELPRVMRSSGPVSVPELDDWNESPDVRIRLVRRPGADNED